MYRAEIVVAMDMAEIPSVLAYVVYSRSALLSNFTRTRECLSRDSSNCATNRASTITMDDNRLSVDTSDHPRVDFEEKQTPISVENPVACDKPSFNAIREPSNTFDVLDADQHAGDAAPPPSYSAFSPTRRRFILGLVTVSGFFGPLTGAVYLPSLVLFQTIFHTSATVIDATVSVYMVVFAIAVGFLVRIERPILIACVQPLFGAAASDYGGRKTVYIFGLGSFLIANILLASVPANIGALFFLRIFQALGSCIVFSVGAGTVADITEPKARASAMGIFLLGPQLGPILGPLIGGQFADASRWRWIFGFLGTSHGRFGSAMENNLQQLWRVHRSIFSSCFACQKHCDRS